MNPELLTVYKSPFQKQRLGRDKDGGYITIRLPVKYDILVSAGLSEDPSFEEHWLRLNEAHCIAFDGTISRSPSTCQRLEWVNKNISRYKTHKTENLEDLLREHRSIFLKMDIEGHETDWFDNLDQSLMDNIAQIVVEFHHQPYDDVHARVYEKINSTHALLHIHGNNFSGTVRHEGVLMPVSFECTYANRKFVPSPEPNTDPLPGPHDKPNNPAGADISLNHPPFVHPEI